MLFIGIGNRDRGDDAVGVWVAEELSTLGYDAVVCRGEATELMDAWEGHNRVIVIDAIRAECDAGTILLLDAHDETFAANSLPSSHAFGLADAIELARALGTLPGELVVYGVAGICFDTGSPMSDAVFAAAQQLVANLMEEADA